MKKRAGSSAKGRRAYMLEQLEDRIVLDATTDGASQDNPDNPDSPVHHLAPVLTGDHAVDPAQLGGAAPQANPAAGQADPVATIFHQDASQVLVPDRAEVVPDPAGQTEATSAAGPKVLLISSDLANAADLAAAAQHDVITLKYDGATETPQEIIHQVEQALGGQKAASIALATHDVGENTFYLTSDAPISLSSLSNSPELRSFWTDLGHLVEDGGRIDILSCSTGAGEGGLQLVNQLESLTGHAVAASTDSTGNAAFGGDWVLERGEVDLASTYFVADRLERVEGRLATIDWAGNVGWKTLMTGSVFDPSADQQAQKATTDLIGDSQHGVLYSAYDDKGTATPDDDEIAYRVRMGGADSGGSFSSILLMGIDANLDGTIDVFVTVQDTENGIRLWYPGTGMNISPSTTTTDDSLPGHGPQKIVSLTGNYSFTAVTDSNDPDHNKAPDSGTMYDLYGINGTDQFLTFKLPFHLISDQLSEGDSTHSPIIAPIVINKESPIHYVLGTSTQTNAFNSDLGGVGAGNLNSNTSWADLGCFSPVVSASNMFPYFDAPSTADSASVTVTTGATAVTTMGAKDADNDVLTYSIVGGADAPLFKIDPISGALSFLDAANVRNPLDS
ncbi:MAG: DUF4347 domain-containing protein, partial [Candidatus Riflebacteria bacterium]|nr:DUF4347 domain-containing protein [Candidatus Riflebacteria bacterium]